ncbi:MAG TPA: lipopolysaccharide biosynthesis protein [Dongiaceae bacterium]|nr:lipopolysaccharide biosynthesis protein [Dongiaceae bacterium]
MSDRPARDGAGDLAHAARRGLVLTGGSFAARAGLEFGTSVALARLLSPSDFGVVAVAQAFLQLSYVVGNLGMGAAVVQSRELGENGRRTATTVATSTAILLALVCALAAPFAAAFFTMPILKRAMPIMAIEMVMQGFSATPIAILRRRLQYGRAALVDAGSAVVYAVTAVGLALTGHGVWSLVFTPLVSGTWSVVASYAIAGYRPRFGFDREAAKRLLGYGGSLTVKNLFVHLARNADNLVVAKRLGEYPTGLYTRAFSLSTLPQSRLVSLIYGVSFPVFCRLRDDRERFHAWYLKATTVAAVLVTPLLLGLAVLAPDFTVVVYGPAWADMAGCLRALCLAGLLNSIHMLGGAAIEASGRVRYEVTAQSIYGVSIPIGAFIGSHWGITGVACGVLGAAMVFYVSKGLALRAAIGLSFRDFVRAVLRVVLAGGVMAGSVIAGLSVASRFGFAVTPLSRLVAGTAFGGVVYGLCMATLARREMAVVVDQLAGMLGRRQGGAANGTTVDEGA